MLKRRAFEIKRRSGLLSACNYTACPIAGILREGALLFPTFAPHMIIREFTAAVDLRPRKIRCFSASRNERGE